jgi:hypothetical protein
MGSPGSRSRFTCVRFRYAVAYRMQRLYIHNGQSFRDALRPEQAEVSRIFAD